MKTIKITFYILGIIIFLQLIDWSFLDISFIEETLKGMPKWFQITFDIILKILTIGGMFLFGLKTYYKIKEND